MGQPLADCDFNLAALHPAYPIKRRTSAERTQASPERRHPEESPALDPLENSISQIAVVHRRHGDVRHAWAVRVFSSFGAARAARLLRLPLALAQQKSSLVVK